MCACKVRWADRQGADGTGVLLVPIYHAPRRVAARSFARRYVHAVKVKHTMDEPGHRKRTQGALPVSSSSSSGKGRLSDSDDVVDSPASALLGDIEEQLADTIDASGHKYVNQRKVCCGYPSTKSCLAGTFISFKFWASLAGILFVVITLLVIDAKVNQSIYMTKALAFWNMNEAEKIQNLTHDCICIQFMCQENSNGTKIVHSNPISEGRVGTHQ